MKKILTSLILGSLLMGVALPVLAAEAIPETCTIRRDVSAFFNDCEPAGTEVGIDDEGAEGTRGAMCCLFGTILYVVDLIFMIVMIVVVIFILLGAFTIMTASGSEEGIKKGRTYIVFALVGVAVALMAKALPWILRTIIGY